MVKLTITINEEEMELARKFNTYSNADLLRIIESCDDYQPRAVEIAKAILASRQLSEKEIQIAKEELDVQKRQQEEKSNSKWNLEKEIKNKGALILNNLNPIQMQAPDTAKTINIISLVFCLISLYEFYKQSEIIRYIYNYSFPNRDFDMVLYFLPIFVLPVITILFYKRKKSGWILLAIYLAFSALSSIWLFISAMNTISSTHSVFDHSFPQQPPITQLVGFVITSGILWRICKQDIREIYRIGAK